MERPLTTINWTRVDDKETAGEHPLPAPTTGAAAVPAGGWIAMRKQTLEQCCWRRSPS